MSTLHAGGALVWRMSPTGLQVLLIHRPDFDDWSWPKGKPKKKEPMAVCAAREVEEETGVRVVLGVPLPAVTYDLSTGQEKVNHYWAARALGSSPLRYPRDPVTPAKESEVDEVRWVDVLSAWTMLTRRADREPLKALIDAHADGHLNTTPVLITGSREADGEKKRHRFEQLCSVFGVTVAPRHSYLHQAQVNPQQIKKVVDSSLRDTFHTSLLVANPSGLPTVINALKDRARKRLRHLVTSPGAKQVLTAHVKPRPGKKNPRIVSFELHDL